MRTIIFIAAFLLPGCSTIRVHNIGPHGSETYQTASTFHTVGFGFAPISSPMSLKEKCELGWSTLTSEISLIHAVFHVVTLKLFSPVNVIIDCRDPMRDPT